MQRLCLRIFTVLQYFLLGSFYSTSYSGVSTVLLTREFLQYFLLGSFYSTSYSGVSTVDYAAFEFCVSVFNLREFI